MSAKRHKEDHPIVVESSPEPDTAPTADAAAGVPWTWPQWEGGKKEESPLIAKLPQELTNNVRSFLPPRHKVMANRATRQLNSDGWAPEQFWNTPGETNGVVDLNKVPDWTLGDILAHLEQIAELLPWEPPGTERKQTAVVNQVKKAVANSEATQQRVLAVLYPNLPTVHLFKWGDEFAFKYKTLLFTSILPHVPTMAFCEQSYGFNEPELSGIHIRFFDPENPQTDPYDQFVSPWEDAELSNTSSWTVGNRTDFIGHNGFGKIKTMDGIASGLEQPAQEDVELLSNRFFQTAEIKPEYVDRAAFESMSVELLVGALIPDGVVVKHRTLQLHKTAKVRVVDAAV